MSVIVLCLSIIIVCPLFILCGEAPKLIPLVFPSGLTQGSKAQTICSAYVGSPPLHFRWLKDDKPLSLGTVEQINARLSEVILEKLELKHIGKYTCIVSNSFGSDESSAILFAKAPPTWVKEPIDVKVPIMGKAIINCDASGSPPVNVTWQRILTLGDKVPVMPSLNIQIHVNNTMIITSAKKSDDGLYACEVSNGIGENLQKSFSVTVYEKPEVWNMAEHVTVEKGHKAFLSCFVIGDNPISLTWKKNRKALSDWPDFSNKFTFLEHPETNSTKFMATINTVGMEDEGLYTCEAINEFGSDQKDIHLFIVEKPHFPDSIEVVDIWSRSARIKWEAPPNGNSPILNYIVEYWSSSGLHHNETISSTTTSCILRDLMPFTLYKFTVWAVNSIGTSDPSALAQFTTAKEEPTAPPIDIVVEDTGSTFVRLSWNPPPHESWNGGIVGYYVGYKLDSSNGEYTYNSVEPVEDQVFYVLRGLKKASRYSVVVRAYNEIGSGPLSQPISVKTKSHEPPPRPNLMVKSIGSTHLQLQWFVDNESKSSVNGYILYFRRHMGTWQEIVIPDVMQNTFTLTNLDSGVSYQVYMTSQSSSTMSEPSDTTTVQTMHETMTHKEKNIPPVLSQAALDEFTQTLYIVVPISVATVIIVTVIVVACVYVYSKKPPPVSSLYGDLPPPDKNFSYMATIPRNKDITIPCSFDMKKQGSPYSTFQLTRSQQEEEEPIYESVMEEIRSQIKHRNFKESQLERGTIV